ncbi:hypothetical protein TKK_0017843 [Trichogramma kaykai]
MAVLEHRSNNHYSLFAVVEAIVNHQGDPAQNLQQWLTSVADSSGVRQRRPGVARHGRIAANAGAISDRQQERLLYKKIKALWRKSMRKAAALILDGDSDGSEVPSLEAQVAFWKPVMTSPKAVAGEDQPNFINDAAARQLWNLWRPITIEEVRLLRPKKDTAAGPDGVSPAYWGRIPEVIKALAFNCILHLGSCLDAVLNSRTILIPKSEGTMDPALFRPLSIPSIILRHLHRILADRVAVDMQMDRRQRTFMVTDGIAQNISLLAAVMLDARKQRLRPLHMAVSTLVFADDVILLAFTREGLQESLDCISREVRAQGMELMPVKCSTLSIAVNGRGKQRKVVMDNPFRVDDVSVRQLNTEDEFKYLRVTFDCNGPIWKPCNLKEKLYGISRAPIKAQMRLKVLETYLLPRYIHTLTLGRTTHAELKAMDKLVRRSVRSWLRLPHDCPNAFIHAGRNYGGLGIPSLASIVPLIRKNRLEAINQSGAFFAEDLIESEWARKQMDW